LLGFRLTPTDTPPERRETTGYTYTRPAASLE
jgi:hypothetical protein